VRESRWEQDNEQWHLLILEELLEGTRRYGDTPFDSEFTDDFGDFGSLAELFRQIGYDERLHKLQSEAAMHTPRFA
jgi:hypothetical protein